MKKTNIYAEFRIMGDAFDPALVTRALAVQPTEVWQKGDCVYSNRGKCTALRRQYTNWGYKTTTLETLYIDEPIQILQETYEDKVDSLLELKKQHDLSFSIDIVIEVENNEPPAMCLQGFILALHARIDMDMYILDESV